MNAPPTEEFVAQILPVPTQQVMHLMFAFLQNSNLYIPVLIYF